MPTLLFENLVHGRDSAPTVLQHSLRLRGSRCLPAPTSSGIALYQSTSSYLFDTVFTELHSPRWFPITTLRALEQGVSRASHCRAVPSRSPGSGCHLLALSSHWIDTGSGALSPLPKQQRTILRIRLPTGMSTWRTTSSPHSHCSIPRRRLPARTGRANLPSSQSRSGPCD